MNDKETQRRADQKWINSFEIKQIYDEWGLYYKGFEGALVHVATFKRKEECDRLLFMSLKGLKTDRYKDALTRIGEHRTRSKGEFVPTPEAEIAITVLEETKSG